MAHYLPAHGYLDRLGMGTWDPGSSSLTPLGELGDKLDVWELRVLQPQDLSSLETTGQAAKSRRSHPAACQEKK